MHDDQETSAPAHADRRRWPVVGLAVVSLVFWALSYSWLLGLTPPTRWLSSTLSPWLLMEIAAVVTGAVAVLGGVRLARRADTRPAGVRAIWLGGFAVLATTVSLVAYVA